MITKLLSIQSLGSSFWVSDQIWSIYSIGNREMIGLKWLTSEFHNSKNFWITEDRKDHRDHNSFEYFPAWSSRIQRFNIEN